MTFAQPCMIRGTVTLLNTEREKHRLTMTQPGVRPVHAPGSSYDPNSTADPNDLHLQEEYEVPYTVRL